MHINQPSPVSGQLVVDQHFFPFAEVPEPKPVCKKNRVLSLRQTNVFTLRNVSGGRRKLEKKNVTALKSRRTEHLIYTRLLKTDVVVLFIITPYDC